METITEHMNLILAHLPHQMQVDLIMTASDAAIKSAIGKFAVAKRKQAHRPPKVLRPCPHCGQEYGAAEMRKHIPQCRKSRP